MELAGYILSLIFCLALVSIASPLLTLLILIRFSGHFNLLYPISILIGSYFLYDCSQGWLGVIALGLFIDESLINFLVGLNTASVIICLILMLFGGALRKIILWPMNKFSGKVFSSLSVNQQSDVLNAVKINKVLFYIFLLIVTFSSYAVANSFIIGHEGWVQRNIDYVSPAQKEQVKQDSLKKALGDFKTQEERDAYFRELERKY